MDGLTFAGLLVQKNAPETNPAAAAPDFADVIETMTPVFRRVVEEGQIMNAEEALSDMKGEIGIVDQSPSEMLVKLGLTAEGILNDIAGKYGLSKHESLQVLSFAIVFATIADTPADERDAQMAALVLESREKISHWSSFVPSDEEIFGDIDWGDEDEEDGDVPI
ncbi:MAG: hypothetical protein Q4P24_10540 [Rhodobacterales bacterium]|nr:hypothetical protein [Rhodobacterales bacterium]